MIKKKIVHLISSFIMLLVLVLSGCSSKSTDSTPRPNLERANLTYGNTDVYVGDILNPILTLYPENAQLKDSTYESSNPEIASVNKNGVVTVLTVGSFQISLTVSSISFGIIKSESLIYTSTIRDILLESITLIYPRLNIFQSQTVIPRIDYSPANASIGYLSFSSSNPDIATVDEFGNLTGVNLGTVKITITSLYKGNEVSFTTQSIRVNEQNIEATSIYINTESELNYEDQSFVNLELTPSNANYSGLVFESLNPSVATISPTGEILVHNTGEFTYRVSSLYDSSITALSSLIHVYHKDYYLARNAVVSEKQLFFLLDEYLRYRNSGSYTGGFSPSLESHMQEFVEIDIPGFTYAGISVGEVKIYLENFYLAYHLAYNESISLEIPYEEVLLDNYYIEDVPYPYHSDYIIESTIVITPQDDYKYDYNRITITERQLLFNDGLDHYNLVKLDGRESDRELLINSSIQNLINYGSLKSISSDASYSYEDISKSIFKDEYLNLGDGETFGIKATITSDAATIYYYFLFDPLASEKIITQGNDSSVLKTNSYDNWYNTIEDLYNYERFILIEDITGALANYEDSLGVIAQDFKEKYDRSSTILVSAEGNFLNIPDEHSLFFLLIGSNSNGYQLLDTIIVYKDFDNFVLSQNGYYLSPLNIVSYNDRLNQNYYKDYDLAKNAGLTMFPMGQFGLVRIKNAGGNPSQEYFSYKYFLYYEGAYVILNLHLYNNLPIWRDSENAIIENNITTATRSMETAEILAIFGDSTNSVPSSGNLTGYVRDSLYITTFILIYEYEGYFTLVDSITKTHYDEGGDAFVIDLSGHYNTLFGEFYSNFMINFLAKYKVLLDTNKLQLIYMGSDYEVLVKELDAELLTQSPTEFLFKEYFQRNEYEPNLKNHFVLLDNNIGVSILSQSDRKVGELLGFKTFDTGYAPDYDLISTPSLEVLRILFGSLGELAFDTPDIYQNFSLYELDNIIYYTGPLSNFPGFFYKVESSFERELENNLASLLFDYADLGEYQDYNRVYYLEYDGVTYILYYSFENTPEELILSTSATLNSKGLAEVSDLMEFSDFELTLFDPSFLSKSTNYPNLTFTVYYDLFENEYRLYVDIEGNPVYLVSHTNRYLLNGDEMKFIFAEEIGSTSISLFGVFYWEIEEGLIGYELFSYTSNDIVNTSIRESIDPSTYRFLPTLTNDEAMAVFNSFNYGYPYSIGPTYVGVTDSGHLVLYLPLEVGYLTVEVSNNLNTRFSQEDIEFFFRDYYNEYEYQPDDQVYIRDYYTQVMMVLVRNNQTEFTVLSSLALDDCTEFVTETNTVNALDVDIELASLLSNGVFDQYQSATDLYFLYSFNNYVFLKKVNSSYYVINRILNTNILTNDTILLFPINYPSGGDYYGNRDVYTKQFTDNGHTMIKYYLIDQSETIPVILETATFERLGEAGYPNKIQATSYEISQLFPSVYNQINNGTNNFWIELLFSFTYADGYLRLGHQLLSNYILIDQIPGIELSTDETKLIFKTYYQSHSQNDSDKGYMIKTSAMIFYLLYNEGGTFLAKDNSSSLPVGIAFTNSIKVDLGSPAFEDFFLTDALAVSNYPSVTYVTLVDSLDYASIVAIINGNYYVVATKPMTIVQGGNYDFLLEQYNGDKTGDFVAYSIKDSSQDDYFYLLKLIDDQYEVVLSIAGF